jgi:hypothetical protein
MRDLVPTPGPGPSGFELTLWLAGGAIVAGITIAIVNIVLAILA